MRTRRRNALRAQDRAPIPGLRWILLAVVLVGQVVPATLVLTGAGAGDLTGASGPAADTGLSPRAASAVPPGASLASSMDWIAWSPDAPVGTAGAGFATNTSTGEAILFGGETDLGLSSAGYLYWESNNTWTAANSTGAPTPRAYFGFSSDPAQNAAVLFGGETNLTTLSVTNDTWVYDFGSGAWTNVSGPVAPAARQDPAFAIGDGVALLFGGWAQNTSGIGEQTFSDTWLLNLSTDVWTRDAVLGPNPGALHGASLAWDPGLGEFFLTGGCYPCSSALWAFSPTNLTWSSVPAAGVAPPGAMNSVWTYDSSSNLLVRYGGTNGTIAQEGTYLYRATPSEWVRSSAANPPSARWGAAAGFLDLPGNATLFLTGGTNGSGPLADTWRFSQDVNLTVFVRSSLADVGVANATVSVGFEATLLTNSTGYATGDGLPAMATPIEVEAIGYLDYRGVFWLPPGADLHLTLTLTALAPGTLFVQVETPAHVGVVDAEISLLNGTQHATGSPGVSGLGGVATFPLVLSANYTITVNKTGFHGFESEVWVLPGVQTNETVTFLPLFVLTVSTFAALPNGTTVPLAGAAITPAGHALLGTTNSSGVLVANLEISGNLTFRAEEYGFFNKSAIVNVSTTGEGFLNLTLTPRPYPVITIEILGQLGHGTGFPVFNATVSVRNQSAIPTGGYATNLTTSVEGAVTFSPPSGNYSVEVSAAGFVTNDSIPTLVAPFGANLSRTYYLSLIGFSSISVLVLSTANGNPPIAGARLGLTFSGTNLSDGRPYPPKAGSSLTTGWANFSGIPQGTTYWSANATGFEPANGSFAVVYGSPHNIFTIYLRPIPPPRYAGLSIFPTAANAFWSLLLLPAAGVVGALVYLTVLRNPSSRDREVRDAAEVERLRRRRESG